MNKQHDTPNQLSQKLLDVAVRAAQNVGPMLLEGFEQGVSASEKAGFYDLVTAYDRNAEQALKKYIFEHHPDSSFVGEEGGAVGNGAVRWYVDPIDGTTNFATGFPFFCVSIGAEVDNQILAGVVFDPVRNELFSASPAGVFLNGRPIRPNGANSEKTAVVLTDFPGPGQDDLPKDYLLFGQLSQRVRAVRRMGSTALEMAYVACGRADATVALHINPWDVAAGYLLITRVGGIYLPLGSHVERPWLNPGFIGHTVQFDFERSILGEFVTQYA